MKVFFLTLLFSVSACAGITSIYDTKNKQIINSKDFLSKLQDAQFVVLGEFHNDPAIQSVEGQIIKDVSLTSQKKQNISVMWEFLDFTDQTKIETEFEKFRQGIITSKDFLTATAGKQNLEYAPVIEATKEISARLVGLNLPREYKQKVIKEGINSIDPSLVPSSHYVGGNEYLERFKETMGGHVPESKIPAYFEVQCLTDSVMAHQTSINASDLNFVIAGSFHTDFYDATVARLKKLTSQKIVTLKIINDSNASAEEVKSYHSGDPKYGAYADYIILAR